MTEVGLPALSYIVTMNERGIRRRRALAVNIKIATYVRTTSVTTFENDFAHLAWGVDFGLAEPSVVSSPKWRYKGRFVESTESQWLSEEEARDSFTLLQLDVFHTLWETYHRAECQARPASTLTRKERDGIDREHALK